MANPGEPDTARARSARWRIGTVVGFVVVASCLQFLDLVAPRGRAAYYGTDPVAWEGHAWALEFDQIAGRDFLSTYGRGAQLLSWTAVQLHEAGDFLSSPPRILFVFCLLATLLLGIFVLLTASRSTASVVLATLLLFGFGLPWHYAVMRPAAAAVAAVVALRLVERSSSAGRAWLATGGGALCALVGTLTPETGLYALLATAFAWVFAPAEVRAGIAPSPAARVRGAGLLALGYVVVVWLFAGGPRAGATTMRETFHLMATYPWAVAKPWSLAALPTAVLAIAFLGTLLWTVRTPHERPRGIALSLLALAYLPSGWIRSDDGHLALALTPAILLLGTLAPARVVRSAGLAGWLALVLLFAGAWPTRDWQRLPQRLAAVVERSPLSAWQVLRRDVAPPRPFPDDLMTRAQADRRPIFVFPEQNHLGPASGRQLAARVDQSYKAHDNRLQNAQVESLAAARGDLVVFAQTGSALDGVQDFSRSPIVLETLLRSFRPVVDAPLRRGWVVLERRDPPRELAWRPLGFRKTGSGAALVAELDPPQECALLRLDLDVEHRILLPGWKPQTLRTTVEVAGGEVVSTRLIPLAIGRPYWTLVALETGFGSSRLFWDEATWPRRRVVRVRLEPDRADFWTAPVAEIRQLTLSCI
ncbi:MAG: hypothetical protein AB7G12_12040 [Thermoanaerobaculia bacterium]